MSTVGCRRRLRVCSPRLELTNERVDDALLQVSKVYSLNGPEEESVKTLREWLERKEYGNGEITAAERKAWAEADLRGIRREAEDLVAIQSRAPDKAPFSSWASGRLLTIFHNKIGSKIKVRLSVRSPQNAASPAKSIRAYRAQEILKLAP
jgi:hypothetical protein